MPTIVTVHGTFASGPEEGKDWWQRTSEFETHIRELVEPESGELDYKPVIWDGANSESSRRAAGRKLYDEMQALEKADEPYAVIGHSHGGSVLASSLMESAKRKKPLPNLQRWITIGTPFIQTQKDKYLFYRLGVIGKAAYIALVCASLMFLLAFIEEPMSNIGQSLLHGQYITFAVNVALFAVFFLACVIPLAIFHFALRYITNRRLHLYKDSTIAFADEKFQPRWLSLWHANDEAVQGLKSLKTMKLDIFNTQFAIAPINMLSILILPLTLVIIAISPGLMNFAYSEAKSAGFMGAAPWVEAEATLDDRKDLESKVAWLKQHCGMNDFIARNTITTRTNANGTNFPECLRDNGSNIFANLRLLSDITAHAVAKPFGWVQILKDNFILGVLFSAITMLVISYIITALVGRFAKWMSPKVAGRMNPATMGQLRATALGSDTLVDSAVDAAEWPMWLGKGFPPLPEPLGSELQTNSDAAVAKAVPKFRNAIRSFTASGDASDKSDMISEYLTWDELIHTSYFHSPKFRKLVAFALSKTDGFQVTAAFKADPDYDTILLLHRKLTTAAVDTQDDTAAAPAQAPTPPTGEVVAPMQQPN